MNHIMEEDAETRLVLCVALYSGYDVERSTLTTVVVCYLAGLEDGGLRVEVTGGMGRGPSLVSGDQ